MNLIDIVMPARREAAVIGKALSALLADGEGLDLKVVVVANGEDAQATLASAALFEAEFAEAGHQLVLLENKRAGKAEALNRGDRERRGGAVMYLDADTVILPGTLTPLAMALSGCSDPLLASPPLWLADSSSPLTRAFGRIWMRLPSVRSDVIGAGCYATNTAGRRRWSTFPDLAGDDIFVRSRFERHERRVLENGGYLFALPQGWALVAAKRRWDTGNAQLSKLLKEEGRTMPWATFNISDVRNLISSPRDVPAALAFILIWMVARLGIQKRAANPAWIPNRP